MIFRFEYFLPKIHGSHFEFLQKFKNSIKPDIYECKICGEHNCEHDLYDIEESIQEMQTISPQQVPTKITLQQPPQGRPLLNNRMDHIAENK